LRRRPVTLVYSQHFDRIEDAIAAERQIKGWQREKKEALIRGDYAALPDLARGWGRTDSQRRT
jgi:putative endonuclease